MVQIGHPVAATPLSQLRRPVPTLPHCQAGVATPSCVALLFAHGHSSTDRETRMKVGLYIGTQFTAGSDVGAALQEMKEQVRLARQSGFSSLWVPHHYLTYPMQMLAPIPVLAYLLREADGMTIGPNILIMPLLNPVHVAEDAVTLDLLSGGRYVLGIGVGYREAEFQSFNVPLSERAQRMHESIEIMRRLWREDKITYQGKFFQLNDLGIGLKPVRKGGPPIWLAAVVDVAVKRAAQQGDAWLITNFAQLGVLVPQMRLYRDTLAAANKPFPSDAPIIRECYIGASRAAALEECKAALQYKYGAYSQWGLDRQSAAAESFEQPFAEFARDRFIIGDKAFVKAEIERYHALLGVNHFIMRVQWPGLEQAKVLRTIAILGEIFA
jgi:alkanesulfonate monooxygenase SsuD/methylene tetrahydromethanopterin reductase-like flavin-dependent oxidoreductase (luciferase family)